MSNEAIIFTDGACLGNPGPGGYAAVVTIAGQEQVITGCDRTTTNRAGSENLNGGISGVSA
ncbi:RNase H family protein [Microvirga sp. 0TCS3.31]